MIYSLLIFCGRHKKYPQVGTLCVQAGKLSRRWPEKRVGRLWQVFTGICLNKCLPPEDDKGEIGRATMVFGNRWNFHIAAVSRRRVEGHLVHTLEADRTFNLLLTTSLYVVISCVMGPGFHRFRRDGTGRLQVYFVCFISWQKSTLFAITQLGIFCA